ncbi:MAG: tRNA-(ms[2]io[6]A)-hydroxylase [bacterium]|nr:tRNA-(ms[2]io[6]A)-hydroxylase [bacterium]
MLCLTEPTNPEWAKMAAEHIDEVMLDHAHCEKKAAGGAVRLLFRYPEHRFLCEPMAQLAREELSHFEEVLGWLDRHDIRYKRQQPSRYAGRLHQQVRTNEPERLIDVLLISALIEARSCERFKLLAAAVDDAELAQLFLRLLPCEARHFQVFFDLALRLGPEDEIRTRLEELASAEAAILREPASRPRIHS